MFNLLVEPWLPVIRADGQRDRVRPADITSHICKNPIVAVDWPRADFRVACIEFLIGLVATAWPPSDDEEGWIGGWEKPPSPDVLDAAFSSLAPGFNLDGGGPRFLQDLDDLPGEPDTPETLLIEAPGEETRRKNTALLVKPGRIGCLSRPAAAMALFTLQCYAPQGGSGHRTSVRGGGPLTTLALPGIEPCSLWQQIWANVPSGRAPSLTELPKVFPWLAPTRTADRFPATSPREGHPLQAFWGMPRRIRLAFVQNIDQRACDLTGAIDPVIVTGWQKRNQGINYDLWDHPLSPSRKSGGGGWIAWLAKSGIGYRDWIGIALPDGAGGTRPAQCVSNWVTRSFNLSSCAQNSRLLAAGYHIVNNMKAHAFIESEMPLPGTDRAAADAVAIVARRLVAAAEIVAEATRRAVRDARYRRGTNVKNTSAPLLMVYESFWTATQDRFFTLLTTDHTAEWERALAAVADQWRTALRGTALGLFDEAAPLNPSVSSLDPGRIVAARCNLLRTLEGYGPKGAEFFAELNLPAPERQPRGGKRNGSEKKNDFQ